MTTRVVKRAVPMSVITDAHKSAKTACVHPLSILEVICVTKAGIGNLSSLVKAGMANK